MINLGIFLVIFTALLGVVVIPWPKHPAKNPCENGYAEGYTRAATDIKIFVSGTGKLPNEEWVKRAAKYRLDKNEVSTEGIELGLVPDPKTTLQPFALSENR